MEALGAPADQHTPFVGRFGNVGLCQDPPFDGINLPGGNAPHKGPFSSDVAPPASCHLYGAAALGVPQDVDGGDPDRYLFVVALEERRMLRPRLSRLSRADRQRRAFA